MKNIKMKTMLITAVLVVIFSIPAFSKNTLKNDEHGFWLEDELGYYYANTWVWVEMANDGVFYHCYFGENGYMLINTVAPDGTQINEAGQAVLNGVPITYTINPSNRSTNTSRYVIKVGDMMQNALVNLHNHSVAYTIPFTNCAQYYDEDGKNHFYYFDSAGKCIADIEVIQCDINGANNIMHDRMKRETTPLIDHSVDGNKETYVYMQRGARKKIYGRYFERSISTNGWPIFCDAMFDMEYNDLLNVISQLRPLYF